MECCSEPVNSDIIQLYDGVLRLEEVKVDVGVHARFSHCL